ncbi:MAG: ATP-binding protein [Candidatus Viridilinea halotolerans]|uniref:ATP-binding protein n=1 Tax=Candidatus Viridilinea halotolerans TaxID=2491704 RepID=A0A426U1T9_9CHLR|nr:MAG: ATP-binding protein [Candidatus Viridilinea halotolerans]
MDAPLTAEWSTLNQEYLAGEMERLHALLQARIAQRTGEEVGVQAEPEDVPTLDPPSALERLVWLFELSSFERDLLLLAAAVELDGRFSHLCAALHDNPECSYPTFGLALTNLPGAHWDAFAPSGALRRWRLLELGTGPTLTSSPLRVSEQVLHYLMGMQALDERLLRFLLPVEPPQTLSLSLQTLADGLVATWEQEVAPLPLIQLCGEGYDGKRVVAAAACAQVGLRLYALPSERLPTSMAELDLLVALWQRDAALVPSALLVELDALEGLDAERQRAVGYLLEQVAGPLLLATRERRPLRRRPWVSFEVSKPPLDEQRGLWREVLGGQAAALNGQLDALVAQFDFDWGAIHTTGRLVGQMADADMAAALWRACRLQARSQLESLAQRLEPMATWDDLVLPEAQFQTLQTIAAHVRQRARVYEQWGFAGKGRRGLGMSALFAGPSGTGKTTAAEVLAGVLQLDLYRIDLSALVSKYIGETEKNLRRIFDAAEESGALLLFDEADALFGKRSEVKDSHDRYANIEVSYLLQRMEAYRGLAILTTNMKQSLDQAFLRRIRFVVQFPFPDVAQRTELWRRIFPAATPTEGLDVQKLARLNVAGGNIRTIALNAAFLAADAGTPVQMQHILQAARVEYAKLERPLTEAERW